MWLNSGNMWQKLSAGLAIRRWSETKQKSKFHKLQSISSAANPTVCYKDAYKDAYSCSTQQSQNTVQSKLPSYLCCTCQDTDRYQVANPKKIKMRNPTTNQQQLKKSINAYCAARFFNSSVLTEDQDTTF